MKDKILQTLRDLRVYALEKGVEAGFFYHEEDSHLMRFANSAISLNTNEHLIRLEITAFDGKRRATYEMITDLSKLEEMKQGLDIAAEMVKHAMPLSYQPTNPAYAQDFGDESAYDPQLASLTGEERLAYFNEAVQGLETDDIKLSGIFASGTNVTAQMTTRSEHAQYFKTSDAQINVVLSHQTKKWEVLAEQSAQQKSDLNPAGLQRELSFLLKRYQDELAQQIPVGKYDIVFGAAAIGDLLSIMNWVGFNGGSMKRGFSFIGEDKPGQKVFSDKFNLSDDPTRRETFPFQRDMIGLERKPFPIVEQGVFKGFTWFQDDADEFGVAPSGHTVMHKSLVLAGGEEQVSSLEQLVGLPRENDLLYIPYLHYMNIVNPSKGLITGSSRFGALLLKKDGSVVVPFNVRITQSLLDIFGEKVAWMSQAQTVNNTSASYGARNPTAVIAPTFMRVNDLEISHSNSSY
ncbi:MAG: metallopeptidase TldD-related protein [Anaerolineales bacterium]|nr:metallopeptidase TldD-related protein [Anaerolineales bacterium]